MYLLHYVLWCIKRNSWRWSVVIWLKCQLQYLINCCTLTSDIASHQRIRSATRHQLIILWHCCSRFGRQAFFIAGLRAWNLLPYHVHDNSLSCGSFRSVLFIMQQNT